MRNEFNLWKFPFFRFFTLLPRDLLLLLQNALLVGFFGFDKIESNEGSEKKINKRKILKTPKNKNFFLVRK